MTMTLIVLSFFIPKKEPLKVIKLEKVSAEGNGQSDGELTSEMMLYGYKKTTSEGEAENPMFLSYQRRTRSGK